jgi:hypothetical protein
MFALFIVSRSPVLSHFFGEEIMKDPYQSITILKIVVVLLVVLVIVAAILYLAK